MAWATQRCLAQDPRGLWFQVHRGWSERYLLPGENFWFPMIIMKYLIHPSLLWSSLANRETQVLMNDHVMKTVESHKIGFMVHPFASMCNHSCNPTAFFFHDGASFRMRSAMDIPEGGEITISYIPLTYGFRYRQTKLLVDYDFLCRCKFPHEYLIIT